jgi:stress response protein SCP2
MSVQLQRGGNISLLKTAPDLKQAAIELGWNTTSITGAAIDLDSSAFMVAENGKIPVDDYFIFFNQLASPEGAVQHQGNTVTGDGPGDYQVIWVDLAQVPAHIQKIIFTITIYEAEHRQQNFGMVKNAYIRVINEVNQVELARYNLTETFTEETAMIFGELYRYKEEWKFRAVGQGFAGGLPSMAKTFGVSVEDAPLSPEPPPVVVASPLPPVMVVPPGVVEPPTLIVAPPPPFMPLANQKRVMLEKKLAQAPQMLSLVKKAQISLDKAKLTDHRAKVALCLDISGSMHEFYRSGKIQRLAERVLALGCGFDDDGAIDIFMFGYDAHNPGEMTLDNFGDFIKQIQKKIPLEGSTYYAKVMELIRKFYFPVAEKQLTPEKPKSWFSRLFSGGDSFDLPRSNPIKAAMPVYVMFITDGEPTDPEKAKEHLRWASHEPIFWQFMAIGQAKVTFLENLDTLSDRYVDNAGFFSVKDPTTIADEELYDLLMKEYPKWVTLAKQKQLLE